MNSNINSIAVLGAGTMGAGIAALAADKDCKVLLLDISDEAAQKGKDSMISERNPMLSDPTKINNVETGTFENDFELIKNYDVQTLIRIGSCGGMVEKAVSYTHLTLPTKA